MSRLLASLARFRDAEPHLIDAARLARAKGCRILLVGGAVRDLALGRPIVDLDFVLEGRGAAFLGPLAKLLGHRVVTFRKKGIVDHRIRAGAREWDLVASEGRSLRAELKRRDFTINAIAWDPLTERLFDPTGGVRDLPARRIRATGTGIFRDDPLRMLRAVRLAAELGESAIERRTSLWIRRDAALIARVSAERVKSELDRILTSRAPSRAIRRLDALGLLARVLPELEPLRGLVQNRYHHLDAHRHTLAALEAADDLRRLARGLPRDVVPDDPRRIRQLRWGLLLHDTGKAETRTRDESGEYHFYLHERASARIARAVLRRLRVSREELASIERLVALHLRISLPGAGTVTPRALRRIVRDAGDLVPVLILHTLADKIASHGPAHARTLARLRRAGRDLIKAWKSEIARGLREAPFVTGHDVMRVLEIDPGPQVGTLLVEVAERQSSRALRSREEALAWLSARGGAAQSVAKPSSRKRK